MLRTAHASRMRDASHTICRCARRTLCRSRYLTTVVLSVCSSFTPIYTPCPGLRTPRRNAVALQPYMLALTLDAPITSAQEARVGILPRGRHVRGRGLCKRPARHSARGAASGLRVGRERPSAAAAWPSLLHIGFTSASHRSLKRGGFRRSRASGRMSRRSGASASGGGAAAHQPERTARNRRAGARERLGRGGDRGGARGRGGGALLA